jgi:ribosomal-protein-alanine N-acetyltransferase
MTAAEPGGLVDPSSGYFALLDGDRLIGFRSFGADGQVPGGPYDDSALDTGGGLRPELTGRGLGRAAIETGLAFGLERFSPQAFRVTIASFNVRAQRVVESLGFRNIGRFDALTNGWSYEVLVRPAAPASPPQRRSFGVDRGRFDVPDDFNAPLPPQVQRAFEA